MIGIKYLFVAFAIICSIEAKRYLNYNETRLSILEEEERQMLGGTLKLNEKEEKVNNLLMKAKTQETNEGFANVSNYAPGMHFFKAKPLIDKSRIYKFLQKMPKGASLHGHNTAIVSSEWMIHNVTYRKGLKMCTNKKGVLILSFRAIADCSSEARLVSELRSKAADVVKFDRNIELSFNLYTPTPEVDYPDVNAVWAKFQNMFSTISDVIKYLPVFKDYHKQILQEYYDDNVMYTEIRTSYGELYDDDGRTYSNEESAAIMREIFQEFTKTHPGFLGAKTIYATGRRTTPQTIQQKLDLFKKLYAMYSDFLVGFDLVGQEDLGNHLVQFQNELKELPNGAQYFFHAGETNWYGASTDLNLVDAILLNTKRIGHGYALSKHPFLLEAVKSRGIAIEISPLSNQVLGLVHDLRNHPGTVYIAENVPIVIANDDPGFWNAKGLSYDFYYAFMAFAPNTAGLKTLKQLVLNSIKYSVLTNHERMRAYCIFAYSWNKFLNDVLAGEVI